MTRRESFCPLVGGPLNMNVLVIANPGAGIGQTLRYVRSFCGELERRGHCVDTLMAQKPGDWGNKLGKVWEQADRLVIAGGDGTVNAVLNRLPDPSKVPILHLGTGTANVLARDLGLPRQPEALADVLEFGAIRKVDMGLVGDRRFLLLTTVGFDATVVEEVEKCRASTLGYHGYAMPMLRGLARWSPIELVVHVDGKQPLVGTNAMVLKAKNYGGFLVFADGAELDSGHFDVVVFRGKTVPALFRYSLAAAMGRASKLSDVTHVIGTTVTIESSAPVAVEVDGDYFGTTPITVELRPLLVPLMVPRA
jgi:diacylglycerol kinase (ATP)